ncbi:hypothetical protein F0U62_03850 [Cystobacter fuscus]|nr:hypothetical protein F0U62_03850 [Cystobacter fuscus]
MAHLDAWSYRAGNKEKGRVAMELDLANPRTKTWTLTGAMLRGPKGEELIPLPEGPPVFSTTHPTRWLDGRAHISV